MIYHMIHNDDEEFTCVSLDIDICRAEVDQWDRLILGLSRNQTLTRLDLVRGLQRMVATDADLQQLFAAMRQIPNLSEIRLDCFSTEDMEHTGSLLAGNENIHSVLIENVRVVRDARNSNRYDGVVGNLAAMSCLRSLHVEIPTETEPVELPFAPLLSAGTSALETLVVESTSSLPILEPHFQSMTRALSHPDSLLRLLDIDLKVFPTGLEQVAEMLKLNHTLQDLRLHIHPSIQEQPDITMKFLNVLKANNQSLKKFANYGLLSYTPTPSMINAEFEMLESNLSLESFAMFNEGHETRTKREMFLKLNQRGRRLVHLQRENVPKASWTSQLVKHRDDLDCLYYYVNTNPWLCLPIEDAEAITVNELIKKEVKVDDIGRSRDAGSWKKQSSPSHSTEDQQRVAKRLRTDGDS